MQLAWFEKQGWLEVRNAKPQLCFWNEGRLQEQKAFFVHKTQQMFDLGAHNHRISIDNREYFLDASLRVDVHNNIVVPPPNGFIRIRIYSERERRWWLIRCIHGDQPIDLHRFQKENGWSYVQLQWCLGNALGPNHILWLAPQKTYKMVVDIIFEEDVPVVQLQHQEQGYFALCWSRQPLLSQFPVEEGCTWVDELGATIGMSNVMVGDRFVLKSPQGWSLLFQGEEIEELIVERKPAHFSRPWVRTFKPYREIPLKSYNACLLEGMDRMVQRSPFFCSWLVQDQRQSLCSFLFDIDGAELSGDLLWKMNRV